MGGTPSLLYSGAVEAAAGALVGSGVSSVSGTYKMQEGLDATLYSLKQELLKIQCAINAARRRRITDRQLLEWLASLISAFHLGNYYQRTFKSRNSHPPMIASEGMSNLAILPFYRPAKRQRTVENLIFGDKEIKEINDALRMLKSIDTCAFILMVNALPERPLRSYLYMDHNRLLNRDKERDQIMNFLFLPSTAGENNVDILPLVGPSEVGKTSLVLHCFHDPKVQEYFSLKIYDGYSNISYPDFWDTNIFQEYTDENTLLAMLKQKLSSERFLLVMDDVWRVDLTVWNVLLNCRRYGKKGSKIIMIVDSYAYNKLYKKLTIPGMAKPIILDYYSEDDYMIFFKEHAFGSADPEDYPELDKMGREIATEMKGSMWGAKIFGELLRDNLNAQFWSNFLEECLLKRTFPLKHDLYEVVRVISQILPNRLPTKTTIYTCTGFTNHEVKSYRELMVLDPNHCAPVTESEYVIFEFLVTKHIFLNECTDIIAVFFLN